MFEVARRCLNRSIKEKTRRRSNMTQRTEPGEFVDEGAVVLTDPADERDFLDNGVSVSFDRFDDDEEDSDA